MKSTDGADLPRAKEFKRPPAASFGKGDRFSDR